MGTIKENSACQIGSNLLNGEEVIGTTPNGQLMYKGDEPGAMYRIDKKEIDFRAEMEPIFKKIGTEALVMRAMSDTRDIFYIPKRTRLLVEPRSLKSRPYNADTIDRFFAVRNDIIRLDENGEKRTVKTAYEVLPGFSRRILIRKVKDDWSGLEDQSSKIAENRKFFIPREYLKGKRYFNLSEANIFSDFDKFCKFIKECDETANIAKSH